MSLLLAYGLPLVALFVFANELGVPTAVPAEIALLLTGAYVLDSPAMLIGGVLVLVAADLAGTGVLHLLVRFGGHRLLRRFLPASGSGAGPLDRWRDRLGGRDALVVGAVRSLPLVRMYGTVGAALVRMPPRDFLLGAAAGATVWVGVPVGLGYALRPRVQELADRFAAVSGGAVLLLPLVGLAGAALLAFRHRRTLRRLLVARRTRPAAPALPAVLPLPLPEFRPVDLRTEAEHPLAA